MEENINSIKKTKRGRLGGFIIIIVGLFSAWLGIWLFIQTLGTRLLFIDARIGRISRYYWIFLLAACVCLAVGIWCLVHFPTIKKEVRIVKENKENVEGASKPVCPSCGKINAKQSKFCIYCGNSMGKLSKDN